MGGRASWPLHFREDVTSCIAGPDRPDSRGNRAKAGSLPCPMNAIFPQLKLALEKYFVQELNFCQDIFWLKSSPVLVASDHGLAIA